MNILLVVWLGTVAWMTSVLTVAGTILLDSRFGGDKHEIEVVGGLTSAFLWWSFAFGVTSIQVFSGGTRFNTESGGLAMLAAGLGIFMFVVALMGTTWLLNVSDIVAERESMRP